MLESVKAIAAKIDNLSFILGTYMIEEQELNLQDCPLTPHIPWPFPTHTPQHSKINKHQNCFYCICTEHVDFTCHLPLQGA